MQLKVVMLGRLQGFLRANPLGDEPADQVVARFTEKMDRLRALTAQQRAGLVAQAAENRKHREGRRQIIRRPLRHLARVAGSLEAGQRQIAAALTQPVNKLSGTDFLTTTQSIAATAQVHRDLLRSKGMSDVAVQDLLTRIADYDQAVSDANAGRRAHTGASAELRALGKELMELVRQLDGLVVYHFHEQPEVLGAWESSGPLNYAHAARS
ncbi:MAG: hypothetical protein SGJ01_00595 [Gemmatimonadota bacterium]|nr:hypothetical protein [Gemmatimonadota bacterium]